MAYDDDTIWLVQDLTKEKQCAVEKIAWKEIQLNGARVVLPEVRVPPLLTSVIASEHQAIYEAARYLEKASNPERRRIILAFTTDTPTPTRARLGAAHRRPLPSKRGTRSKDEILKYLLAVRGTVYALVMPGYRTPDWEGLLRKLSILSKPVGLIMGGDPWDYANITFYVERTGGEARIVSSENAVAHLGELIDRLYSRYSLGYIPSNMKRDGKFRKIEVRVSPEVERREGGVIIRARKGYYAPREGSRR